MVGGLHGDLFNQVLLTKRISVHVVVLGYIAVWSGC